MDMQDKADECTKMFLEKAEEMKVDTSSIPPQIISKYCRMLIVYCDAEGKVTESFKKSMEKCAEDIISVDGMEEIFNICNVCPEDM